MSKAEKFISDCTRNCSNELIAVESRAGKEVVSYHDWLTPDQARRAVEIAKNEMAERACSFIADNIGEYIELKHASSTTFFEVDGDRFVHDLKQTMKDE
jgi:predicted AAA+ superfamily ATPase